jgi:tetratricopeptide (TPR) repeat protein
VSAGIVLALLLLFLVKLILYRDSAGALVAAVATLALVAAFCAQFGTDLARRVKKLGPLELFETRISEALATLRELHFVTRRDLPGRPLSRNERLDYQRLDSFVDLLEGTNRQAIEASSGLLRHQYHRLLYHVGRTAVGQGDWARAIERLDRLEELTRGQFEPVNTSFSIAFAAISWAQEIEDRVDRAELLRKAVREFERATRQDPHDHVLFYFLAVAQHKLGHFRPAVKSNLKALRLRSDYAPAKYNEVVNWVKLGRLGRAWQRLLEIDETDEKAGTVFETAVSDEDLAPLRNDSTLGPKVVSHLRLKHLRTRQR